jgi:hypothetical protein
MELSGMVLLQFLAPVIPVSSSIVPTVGLRATSVDDNIASDCIHYAII